MRNLKRALSLTLASVMLLGMMVVGSSAAAGYDDVADTDNVEAIEVAQAVGIMIGDENDNFRPGDSVSRAEMAVVMGKLLNLDYNYYEATCPFTDVSGVYDWARGWVGACYANGIVSGRGEGVYDPGATVTAVETASMLMRALGYFKYQSDYANGFEVATVSQATKINLFDGVNSTTGAPLTRNQVAQMVLNALKSGMVEPDGNALNFIDANGNVIATGGKVNYVYVTSTKTFASAISRTTATSIGSNNDGWIVELGEQLYNGDLQLNDQDLDVFQRPARTWEYDGKEIGTYVKKELLREVYTAKVTGKDLYELLTASTIRDYDYVIAIDGETEENVLTGYGYFTPANLIRSNTEAVGKTGNGVITEVYVDSLNEIYYIAVINTYLAKASGDYNEKKDEAKFTVWGLQNVGSTGNEVYVKNTSTAVANPTITLTTEDFDVAGVKDEDICLVHVADGTIQVMMDPEVIDNTKITSFKKGDWVVSDGTKYDYNNAIEYDEEVLDAYDDFNMKDTTYRVYLDANGYALGVAIVEEADQYVFITGLEWNGSNLSNKQADANAIFLDGTMKTIKVNMSKSKMDDDTDMAHNALFNSWCIYSENSDGTYTLTQVADDNDAYIRNSKNVLWGDGKTDKVGQGRDYDLVDDGAGNLINNTAVKDDYKKISTKNWYLSGIAGSDEKTVYGNDDSVYITTKVKKLTTTYNPTTQIAVVIDDVDTLSTGIQSTSINVWNAAKAATDAEWDNWNVNNPEGTTEEKLERTSSGVYTLFKDNGYVIAAVVVGEDDGATSQYAFVHSSDVKQEDWTATETRSEDGIYTWYRDVILEGEEVTLVEKTDTKPEIGQDNMVRGNWYKVKFKADGTVRKVEAVTYATNDEGLNDITHLDAKINGKQIDGVTYTAKDTVVLNDWSSRVDGKVISYKGSTLQVETGDGVVSYGFPVFSDAKIVLIQDKTIDGTDRKVMDIVTSYVGAKGLEEAINHLNENSSARPFRGGIGAIVKDGRATAVVICETNATNVNTGGQWNKSHYDVTFSNADYNTNWYDFYVGESNTPLEASDFRTSGIMRTIRVPADETVVINTKNTWGGFDLTGGVEIGHYDNDSAKVYGTINRWATALSFVVDGDMTLDSAVAGSNAVIPDIDEGLKTYFEMPREDQKISNAGNSVSFNIYDKKAGASLAKAAVTATEFVKGEKYDVYYTITSSTAVVKATVTCVTNGMITVNVPVSYDKDQTANIIISVTDITETPAGNVGMDTNGNITSIDVEMPATFPATVELTDDTGKVIGTVKFTENATNPDLVDIAVEITDKDVQLTANTNMTVGGEKVDLTLDQDGNASGSTTETPEAGKDATLKSLTYTLGDGDPVEITIKDTMDVELPEGTAADATVTLTAVANDANAVVGTIDPVTLTDGTATVTITVTAQDPSVTKTYTVNFTVASNEQSDDATLASVTVAIEDAEVTEAQVTIDSENDTVAIVLPFGTADDAVVSLTATATDANAVVGTIADVTLADGEGETTITVTAEDTTEKVYTVTIETAADPDGPVAEVNFTEPTLTVGESFPETVEGLDEILQQVGKLTWAVKDGADVGANDTVRYETYTYTLTLRLADANKLFDEQGVVVNGDDTWNGALSLGNTICTVTGDITVTSEDAVPHNPQMYAKRATASDPFELYLYPTADKTTMDDTDVVNAVAAAVGVSASEVSYDAATKTGFITAVGGFSVKATDEGSAAAPHAVYKFTIGSDEPFYAAVGGEVEGLEPNSNYLLSTTPVAENSIIKTTGAEGEEVMTIDEDVFTPVAQQYDYTLVEAYTLDVDSGDITGNKSVKYYKDAQDGWTAFTSETLILPTTRLCYVDTDASENDEVKLMVNGKVVVLTLDGNTQAEIDYADTVDATTKTVTITAGDGQVRVFINGDQYTVGEKEYFADEDPIPLPALAEGEKYIDDLGGTAELTTQKGTDGGRVYYLSTPTEDIYIWTAVAYGTQTDVKITAITMGEGQDKIESAVTDTATLIAKGATVEVEYANKNTTTYAVLGTKEGVTLEDWTEPANTWTGETAGEWTFTMPDTAVAAGDIKVLYTATMPTGPFTKPDPVTGSLWAESDFANAKMDVSITTTGAGTLETTDITAEWGKDTTTVVIGEPTIASDGTSVAYELKLADGATGGVGDSFGDDLTVTIGKLKLVIHIGATA